MKSSSLHDCDCPACTTPPLPPTDDVRALIADLEIEVENDTRAQEALDDPAALQVATEKHIQAREKLLAALSAQSPPTADDGIEGPRFFAMVAETVKEAGLDGDGFWRTCSGCHETNDGQETGDYEHSPAFGCILGGGCRECGGIGAIWDTTDYDAMARDMLAADEARQSPPPIMGEGLAVVAGLFLAAHEGIGADSYDGVEPRYRALMEQAASMARLAGVKPIKLEDLAALATPSLPEGMVMVPREPTSAMLEAGNRMFHSGEVPLNIYRAMIATAPASALRMENGAES